MNSLQTKQKSIQFLALASTAVLFLLSGKTTLAQGVQCDPALVMTADRCAKCHASEVGVWKQTPHYQTFEQLSRNPKAKEICRNMEIRSVKRSGICIDCHFTTKLIGEKVKPVSGISCESCHGAAKNWLDVHYDYGGPTATKEDESPEHAAQRYQSAIELGMRNTRDLYSIASSCFRCHTVPKEKLVNVGGHTAGTAEFELVRYSQGKVRHNFLRSGGQINQKPTKERLRIMYVIGLIADLEHSTRATSEATSKSLYGMTLAKRSADKAVKLFELQKLVSDPNIQEALEAFAAAELSINNKEQLIAVADKIQIAGRKFAAQNDGSGLGAIDSLLPPESEYK